MAIIRSENYDHLQAAFDALADGDTLLIAPGEYTGPYDIDHPHPLSPDGRGIYVLTRKSNITIIPNGRVIINPDCLSDGIFLNRCTDWLCRPGLEVKNAYGHNFYVDGHLTQPFFTTPTAHQGALHICDCSGITFDSPILHDSEIGWHPERGDHVSLISGECYQNGQAGIRIKDTIFASLLNPKSYRNGLFTNRVHQDPPTQLSGKGMSCQGLMFTGTDDLIVDGLISYGNQEDAILNYCGNDPRPATRIKITNCQLQSDHKGKYPMAWSYISMTDGTWEFSNNGLWNNIDPAGGVLYIHPPANPHIAFTPPPGYSNPMPFEQMVVWLKTLNPASAGNYLLKDLPGVPGERLVSLPRSRFSRFEEPIRGMRPAPGTFDDNGIFQTHGLPTPFNFTGSVQPLDPQEVLTLPEGRDFSEARKIYTTYRMQVADRVTGVNADKVVLSDGEFEVLSVAPYQGNFLRHYKVVVIR